MTYSEKLRDPRWQKKRLEILSRDNFKCQECEDTHTTLHVHHKNYYRGRNPWDCANANLITLCKKCHFVEERWKVHFYDTVHDLLLMGKNYKTLYKNVINRNSDDVMITMIPSLDELFNDLYKENGNI